MAERGEEPPFFAALRAQQAALAITSLLVLATLCARPAHGVLQPGDRIAR